MNKGMYELLDELENSLKHSNNSFKYVFLLSILLINPKSSIVRFRDIADKAVEIYFRNIFKYNLIEYRYEKQVPIIQQDMKKYFEEYGLPKLMTVKDKENLIKMIVDRKSKGFFKYVLPCFLGAKKNENGSYIYPLVGENEFFLYDINQEYIELKNIFLEMLDKHYYELQIITISSYIDYLEKLNPDVYIKDIIEYYIL